MLPLYTRWMSVEEYGLADIITVYVTFLLGLVTCCISEAVFIFPKGQSKEIQKTYYSSALIFMLTMFGITASLFILFGIGAKQFEIKNSFTENLWLIYFMLLSNALMQFSQQFTRSIDKMTVYSITGIISTASTALFSFLLIPSYNVVGYVWSLILAHLTACLYSFLFSRSYQYIELSSLSYKALQLLLRYSIPLIPNSIMWWIVHAINRPIMEANLGLHEIGIYAVANKFPSIISMLFSIFVTSWQISVLEEFGKKDYGQFYNKVLRLLFVVLIILLVLLTLTSRLLISLLADEKYYEAWKFIPLLALGVVFQSIAGVAGSHFSATKESKYYFYSSLWGAIVALLLNLILIPLWGVYGACLSVIFSFVALALARIFFGWKYVKIAHVNFYIQAVFFTCLILAIEVMQINHLISILLASIFIAWLLYTNENLVKFIFKDVRKSLKL